MSDKKDRKLSSKVVAQQSGLAPLECPHCHRHCATDRVLAYFFQKILEHVKDGKEVSIPRLGTFRLGVVKGRRMETPLMPDGAVEFGDRHVLRFHQHRHAKEFLNDDPPRDQRGGAKKPAAKKKATGKKAVR